MIAVSTLATVAVVGAALLLALPVILALALTRAAGQVDEQAEHLRVMHVPR